MDIKERNELIKNHLYLADSISGSRKKFVPRCVGYEELRSAAYMGLVDAATKYTGGNFSAYASFRINGAIKDYLRELSWGSRSNPVKKESLQDNHHKEDKFSELFYYLTKDMSERCRLIFELYYRDGYDQGEISEKIGLSKPRICQILSQCCEDIRNIWDKQKLWDEVA